MNSAAIAKWTPTVARLDAVDPAGCAFHVASPNENFRVRRFGGELPFVSRMVNACGADDTLFDIGASVGLVTIHARRRGAGVVAFEPDPAVRQRLAENLSLNGISDVRLIDWAASDTCGTATLFTDGLHGASPSLIAQSPRSSLTILTRTIDDAWTSGELPTATVVKIDVEGAEVRVLRGMTHFLTSPERPRLLFIEVHPDFLPAFGDRPEDIERMLLKRAYVLTDRQTRDDQTHEVWEAR